MLGYFAMVGQLRCLTIIGEYESAIRALEPIEIFNRQTLLAAKLTTCNITLFYYAGFSYFMLGRYLDATRCFNTVIGFINRITAAGSTVSDVRPLPICCACAPVASIYTSALGRPSATPSAPLLPHHRRLILIH